MVQPAEAMQLHSAPLRNEVEALKRTFEEDKAELLRSEQVQQTLKEAQLKLQQRCDELDAQNAKLRAEAEIDDSSQALKLEIEAATKTCEALEVQNDRLLAEVASTTRLRGEHDARSAALVERCSEEGAAARVHNEAAVLAEARCAEATRKARSMVTAEALSRATEEALQVQEQLIQQEAEAARLRQALADSWAARTDSGPKTGGREGADLQSLDNMEEELRWLASAQQQASAEVHHVQHLERTEAALQARLRALSEEKASLQSARVDLGDAGKAMREAVASQSEGYVRRVGALEEERRDMEGDRKKLLQECADLQARLEAIRPELVGVEELEEQHRALEAARGTLADESRRLRDINGALGALLLGDAGSGSGEASRTAEELTRVAQLLRRFSERMGAHEQERQKLADKIRGLEREAAQCGSSATPVREVPAAAAPKAVVAAPQALLGRPLASATSALRGGLGRLRDAAMDAL